MIATVIGATGRIGSAVVQGLLSTDTRVRVLVRDPGKVGAFDLVRRLARSGVAPGQAELLVTREWAIMAGENERVTSTVRDLTGHEPRTIENFFHENRELFR
jgi:uncharacterized protein YbjT (DUF2867 family)